MIAILAMLIDHTAAVLLYRFMMEPVQNAALVSGISEVMILVYYVMRLIGRLGFPIFIFLLTEGLTHTRNQWMYLLRMALFALISEIPFDFAFNLDKEDIFAGRIVEFTYQNVFFTLAIGLAALIGIKAVQKAKWKALPKIFVTFLLAATGMWLASFLRTDYGAVGVLAIIVMYLLRERRMFSVAATCVILMFSSIVEVSAFLILLPIRAYNGTRGWNLKWIFYVFYPAHLLVLWLICLCLGIA